MSGDSHLRVLLVLKHAGYIAVYEPLVRELARRGHSVDIGYVSADRDGGVTLDRLSEHPRVSSGPAPQRGVLDGWATVAWLARALGDLGRYSDPSFAKAVALRERMAAKVEGHLAHAAGFDPLTRRVALRRARQLDSRTDAALAEQAIRTSRRLESGVPTSRRVTAFVRRHAADVVLVSPLIELASPLLDYLKAARRLGLRTGICVASWDNLTSKGLLRFVAERVFVWNETQFREAVELHGIPADRVVATGAARFDDWFEQQPSSSRKEFVRTIGLDPARPYLLYLCSSAFVAPDEVGSVSSWIESLRSSRDERLRGVGVLVRPHPKRLESWRSADLSRFGNAVVWSRKSDPADPAESRAGFYDSVAHSAAVVGVNTSAMLEAAIVGKSVYTLVSPEFAQEGTLHFHYLLDQNGGFLHVAETQHEHFAQLSRGLAHEAEEAEQARRFIGSFLRPGGPGRSATTIYADAVEELARLPVERTDARPSMSMRLVLTPLALASSIALAITVAKAALRTRLRRKPAAEPGKAHVGPVRA
jgi:hypothetical protein